jgi:hypothetical protein
MNIVDDARSKLNRGPIGGPEATGRDVTPGGGEIEETSTWHIS